MQFNSRIVACIGSIGLMLLTMVAVDVQAQSVCLPAPRLLTTYPMGATSGSSVEVTLTGENLDKAEGMHFSHPAITATPVLDAAGNAVANRYRVTVASDCPTGVYDAFVMTRLGMSTARAFSVGALPEVVQEGKNVSLESAQSLSLNSVCNAVMTRQAVDFYRFSAEQGQRVIVDCAAAGIESKLNPVVIIADSAGADLVVERRGGLLDFQVPQSGEYIVKVHDLTYNGGVGHFYRLCLRTAGETEIVTRMPGTRDVNAFSWPPAGLAEQTELAEVEPNNGHSEAQSLSLPCDLTGSFYPAADVDTFEFTAKKGDVWWVEVASERLGLPTDPTIIVQTVDQSGGQEVRIDLVELTDIASPIKVSSNGYSYDGPPYNAGSTDVLGKIEIKQDGLHRLQLHDAFGGTRNEPGNRYRLVIRKAEPDFAVVGWALHMNLRNGDRNALSKPLALRGGSTIPIEVVAVRRDGFAGEIELSLDHLPAGVTAAGLTIPAGKTRGILLVTAAADAPRGFSLAKFTATGQIDGQTVTRPAYMASMKWPVPNAWSQIPSPRLLAAIPVSVGASELAPLTLAAAEDNVIEAQVGQTVEIPLAHSVREDFSGNVISLKTFGAGFEKVKPFEAKLLESSSTATLDLAALKTPPGEYTIAFYGSAVAKYRHNLPAVAEAEKALAAAQKKIEDLKIEQNTLADLAQTVTEDSKAGLEKRKADLTQELKSAEAAVKLAQNSLERVQKAAQPKDIVDIVVTPPITLRVLTAE